MIVDDERATCHLVRTILRSMEHDVTISYDGEDALNRLGGGTEHLPDLIILDIMLPKMSGYEVADKLKHNTSLKEIPIVLFSAKDTRELEQKAKEVGAVGIIPKPFAIEDFQKIVINSFH